MSQTVEIAATLDSTPCVHCTYNLRGLLPDGNCPECGKSIHESIATYGLRGVTARWFTAVRLGMVMYGASGVANIAWLVARWALSRFTFLRPWRSQFQTGVVGMAIDLVIDFALWWALHLLAEKRTSLGRDPGNDKCARLVRCAANGMLAMGLCQLAYIYSLTQWIPGIRAVKHLTLSQTLYLISSLVSVWVIFALFGLIADIAKVMAKDALRHQAVLLRWLLGATCGAFTLAFCLDRILAALGVEWSSARISLSATLHGSAVVTLLVGVIWAIMVMIRTFQWLGRFRTFAPAAAALERSPWIPAAAAAVGRAATYAGNRGP